MKSVLIIGAAGGLAQILIHRLRKNQPGLRIVGIDSRATAQLKITENVEYKTIRYTQSQFEKLFREYKFENVIQLGRLSHFYEESISKRIDLNILGTQTILKLSLKFQVKKLILLSTYHVYGALASNPAFIDEESPLRSSLKYPEIRDVTEIDQVAANWMWKHQDKLSTVILRPCAIVGPQIHNFMMRYLLTDYAPVCADFNPMMQFIHEYDMANVIANSLNHLPTGIYNVAPDECLSLYKAKSTLNVSTIPLPSFLIKAAASLTSTLWTFPKYLIDYIQYPCILDNSLLKSSYSGKEKLFKYATHEALALSRLE